MGASLPTLLVQAGVVTRAQLAHVEETAARPLSQLQALIREGLDPRAVAGLLVAEGYGPLISEATLRQADHALDSALPKSRAVSLCAFPVRREQETIVVAMLDPSDAQAVDELAAALHANVRAQPALADALERALSARYRPANDNAAALSRISTYVPTGLESLPPEQLAGPDTHIPTGDEEPETAPPPRRPLTRSLPFRAQRESDGALRTRALTTITASRDMDRVAQVACEVAATAGPRAYFFLIRKSQLLGWEGFGLGVQRADLRTVSLPIDGPSLMCQAIDAGQVMVGRLGDTGTDAVFRATMGSAGRHVGVAPVQVDGRAAALLVLDSVHDERAAHTLLEQLSEALGTSFSALHAKAG